MITVMISSFMLEFTLSFSFFASCPLQVPSLLQIIFSCDAYLSKSISDAFNFRY